MIYVVSLQNTGKYTQNFDTLYPLSRLFTENVAIILPRRSISGGCEAGLWGARGPQSGKKGGTFATKWRVSSRTNGFSHLFGVLNHINFDERKKYLTFAIEKSVETEHCPTKKEQIKQTNINKRRIASRNSNPGWDA